MERPAWVVTWMTASQKLLIAQKDVLLKAPGGPVGIHRAQDSLDVL